MSRLFLNAIRYITALLTVLTILSCSKDNYSSPKKNPGAILTNTGEKWYINEIKNGTFSRLVDFNYDNSNRPTFVASELGYFNIDYSPYKISIANGDTDNSDINGMDLSFTSEGYMSKMYVTKKWGSGSGSGTWHYSYDSNGHLTKASGSYDWMETKYDVENIYSEDVNATFTWEDGNLTKVEVIKTNTTNGESKETTSTYTFTYGSTENECRQPTYAYRSVIYQVNDLMADFVFAGYFGIGTANYPKKRNSTSISYETYSSGPIKTETYGSTTYTYKYI